MLSGCSGSLGCEQADVYRLSNGQNEMGTTDSCAANDTSNVTHVVFC